MGVTIHVSKLGDDSDGASWATAFRTVQRALDAIPDDRGGHRVLIRPDVYMEANLAPAAKGMREAYNVLEADRDGAAGSGRTGFAVLDASDPERGFMALDWWSNFRESPDFSGVAWDRWIIRGIYATGGDGALFWDLPPKIEPFTIVVEDSVGIGRAFGGGLGNVLPRPDEPVVFRRCRLWSLDWWGDASAAYVRFENPAMRDAPDVHFEDCTLVGAQCALKIGNPGFATYSRVRVARSTLIALNFSQPRGTPTDGAIQSVIDGKYMHVDLEDSTVMGYKVFGVRERKETEGAIGCTARGSVRAYVEYEQEVPAGFQRLGSWPVAAFETIAPPSPVSAPAGSSPAIRRAGVVLRDLMEISPVIYAGRLCYVESVRPASGGTRADIHLALRDAETGDTLARFAEGYSLASAIVHEGTLHAFASRRGDSWSDVTHFRSDDLRQWESRIVVAGEDEELFNTSVCPAPGGFAMAYESNDRRFPPFTIKFARSADLETWETVPGAIFGRDRYAACPCIRWADGWYYVLYLEHRLPRWWFETYIARSRDLLSWELSAANPVLAPEEVDDGTNASDPEIIEWDGQTWLYFAASDQMTWATMKRAVWPGPMGEFLAGWFAGGAIPDGGSSPPSDSR